MRVDEEALVAVRLNEPPAAEWREAARLHTDSRSEAREQQTGWSDDTPQLPHHGFEVVFVTGEMKHRRADHNIRSLALERHFLDRLDPEVGLG